MSFVCTPMSSVCHSYVLVCDPDVTRIYWCAIRMSLVCHQSVTRMYSHVIHRSFVCTRMTSVCHSYIIRMYSYVIRMYSYVTRMYSYVNRISLVCGFTMNRVKMFLKKFSSQGPKFQANIRNPSGDCLECGIVIHSQSTNKGLSTLYLA